MIKLYNQYVLKINYKSGISEILKVYSYNIEINSVSVIEFNAVCAGRSTVVFMNVNEIESIYQLKSYKGLFGEKK